MKGIKLIIYQENFFLYLYSGLPVFALVNKNNDLIKMINENDLGFATDFQEPNYLKKLVALIDSIDYDHLSNIKRKNCIEFASKNFHLQYLLKKFYHFLELKNMIF